GYHKSLPKSPKLHHAHRSFVPKRNLRIARLLKRIDARSRLSNSYQTLNSPARRRSTGIGGRTITNTTGPIRHTALINSSRRVISLQGLVVPVSLPERW